MHAERMLSVGSAVPRGFSPAALRAVRERHGVVSAELAEIASVSEPTLARWERGKSVPTVDALARAIRALAGEDDESFDALMAEVINVPAQDRDLADWRALRGFLQPRLAAAIGTTPMQVSTIERSVVKPKPEVARALARTLRISEGEVWAAWQLRRSKPLEPRARVRNREVGVGESGVTLSPQQFTQLLSSTGELARLSKIEPGPLSEDRAAAIRTSTRELLKVIQRISVPYWISVLEANGGPGRVLHAIVEMALGPILDGPISTDVIGTEDGRYVRWLGGRITDADPETESRWRARWEKSRANAGRGPNDAA